MWVSTNVGINRLRKEVIRSYSSKDGINGSEIYPILKDSKDNIWIGSIHGLTIYRNNKFEHVKLKPYSRDFPEYSIWGDGDPAVIQSLLEDNKGKIWIGTSGALFVAENGIVKLLYNSNHFHAIRQDSSGDVWAATDRGILRFRDYQLVNTYDMTDGLPNEMMTTINQDSEGRLWFGGFGGLSEFKNGKFINYTTDQGLVGNYVRSIYEDSDGVLWIGTYGEGLSRFENGLFFNYTMENGLFSDDVFAIEEDKRGNFGYSNRGIYRVKRQELNDVAAGKIKKVNSVNYNKADGMLNNECNGGRQPASPTQTEISGSTQMALL